MQLLQCFCSPWNTALRNAVCQKYGNPTVLPSRGAVKSTAKRTASRKYGINHLWRLTHPQIVAVPACRIRIYGILVLGRIKHRLFPLQPRGQKFAFRNMGEVEYLRHRGSYYKLKACYCLELVNLCGKWIKTNAPKYPFFVMVLHIENFICFPCWMWIDLTRLPPSQSTLDGTWTRKPFGLSRVQPIYRCTLVVLLLSLSLLSISAATNNHDSWEEQIYFIRLSWITNVYYYY